MTHARTISLSKKYQQMDNENKALVSLFIVLAFCSSLFLIAHNTTIVVTSPDVVNFAILWVVSLLAGYLFQIINISLFGSLLAGIILRNAFDFNVSPPFEDWCRTSALCVILLISSMEINIEKVLHLSLLCLRLTLMPGLVEAVVTGILAVLMFQMPVSLAFALGYTLSAVSPAVVVPSVLKLKTKGYGVVKGIPSLVMTASSFDDIAAITGFNVSMGIALDTGRSNNIFLSIFIHGPLQVFIGVAIGCLFGTFLAIAKFCSHQWQRTFIAVQLSIILTYFFKSLHLDGVGPVATITMGIVAQLIWKHESLIEYINSGLNYEITKDDSVSYLLDTGRDLNMLWELSFRPLLFGSIGAAFDISALSGDIIPKACGIIAFGLITRMIIAYVAVGGRKLTKTDRMFVAVAWIPKATVQAALCSVPLAMVEDRMSTYKNYEELNIWAHQIFTTTLIAILITAPLGLISIHLLGPRLLSREELEAETNSPKQKILLNENQSVLNEQKNYADDQPMTTCA